MHRQTKASTPASTRETRRAQGDFMARGVFGQMIYVEREAGLCIVKLSSWPDYLIRDFARDSLRAFDAIRKFVS